MFKKSITSTTEDDKPFRLADINSPAFEKICSLGTEVAGTHINFRTRGRNGTVPEHPPTFSDSTTRADLCRAVPAGESCNQKEGRCCLHFDSGLLHEQLPTQKRPSRETTKIDAAELVDAVGNVRGSSVGLPIRVRAASDSSRCTLSSAFGPPDTKYCFLNLRIYNKI